MKTLILSTLLAISITSSFANEQPSDGNKPPAKVVVPPEQIYHKLNLRGGKITGKTTKEVWLKFSGTNSCRKNFCADGIPVKPFIEAINYYKNNMKKFNNHEYMAIVDFNINSVKERLFLLNLKTGEVEKMLVTHARNTETELGVAGKFSNVIGSEMSSLGFFVTDTDSYVGKHGISLRLDGLSKINSNARERAIVIHGASYATQWFVEHKGRLGHSQGCPAVAPNKIEGLIEKLKGQALLYLHKH